MEEYLAFVDEIGRTVDGKYIYRFDFTPDSETVWGEFFNVAPAAIIPNLQPDKNTLSRTAKAIFPREMVIAKKNYCFSMQDCIDGIIPLMFCEIDENSVEINGEPFYLNFAENLSSVEEKMKSVGIELFDFEDVQIGDESAIDNLIDSIGDENNDDDDIGF